MSEFRNSESPPPLGHQPLSDRMPPGGSSDPDQILSLFLEWVTELGLEPYPAQEEALLELMAERHVVLDTPTGSGKSLVAVALHFKAMCEGRRSFYTSPVKALASEKFFALCDDFGAANVGMLTGDVTINPEAPILCCTAEVLANMALRLGEDTRADYVVMDEFHFYSDRDRGIAWQLPLLALPHSVFLLMSATLGDTRKIEERLRARSGREVAHVWSDERPVPLDFEYRETKIQQTIEELLADGKAPIYIVNFTQRDCAEQAQSLTSIQVSSKDERRHIAQVLEGTQFDSPYGREFQRFLRHGIGVHHAGLLPKYRRLVEQLSQQALLKIMCGTDSLGVGVNIPIRTVLFTRLTKYDGERVTVLSARNFKQIAGRAGRKGFDEDGSVVCQAPEHVIANQKQSARGSGGRKPQKKKAPRGFVPWNRDTFQKLVSRPPEALVSRFRLSHGTLLQVLQRNQTSGSAGGYGDLMELVDLCHEGERARHRLRREAAVLFRSLRRAGILEVVADPESGRRRVRVNADLQEDFSLHHALSLYLIDAVSALDPDAFEYPAEMLSIVESILEDPSPILYKQEDRAKGELIARLKAEGVPYEERIMLVDDVTHPKPNAEFAYQTFEIFSAKHPWVTDEKIRPKSVAREMYEDYASFSGFVKRYQVARSEGVLLRYLSQVHNTLARSVPEGARSEGVYDILAYLRSMLARVDSSLLEEWERLLDPEAPVRENEVEPVQGPPNLSRHPRAFSARVRADLHRLVQALADGDFEAASGCVHSDPANFWSTARFEEALAPFFAEHESLVFNGRARLSEFTTLRATGTGTWDVQQVLLDSNDENLWSLQAQIDLREDPNPEGSLLRLVRIGT